MVEMIEVSWGDDSSEGEGRGDGMESGDDRN